MVKCGNEISALLTTRPRGPPLLKVKVMFCFAFSPQVFTTHIIPTFIDPDRYFEREITVYTKLCVEITWYMCIQDPPMAFIDRINRGAEFETDYFRKFRGCHGNKFDYLVWPALLMYKGGPLVVKGVAQPIKKKHAVHEERLPESEVPYSTMKMPSRGTQRPYTDDVVMSHREPDVFVDQAMEDDPWAQPHNQTPSQGYRQTPTYDERIEPSTPYFDPHNKHRDAEIPVINVTEATDLDEQNRSRSSRRSKGDSYTFDSDPGHGLTSQWKKSKMRDNRMPSAP